jgi:hypothetical protein
MGNIIKPFFSQSDPSSGIYPIPATERLSSPFLMNPAEVGKTHEEPVKDPFEKQAKEEKDAESKENPVTEENRDKSGESTEAKEKGHHGVLLHDPQPGMVGRYPAVYPPVVSGGGSYVRYPPPPWPPVSMPSPPVQPNPYPQPPINPNCPPRPPCPSPFPMPQVK